MLQTKDVQLSTPEAGVSVPGQSPESGRRQVVLMDGDRHHSRVLPGAGDTADTMSCLLHIYSVDSCTGIVIGQVQRDMSKLEVSKSCVFDTSEIETAIRQINT